MDQTKQYRSGVSYGFKFAEETFLQKNKGSLITGTVAGGVAGLGSYGFLEALKALPGPPMNHNALIAAGIGLPIAAGAGLLYKALTKTKDKQ